MTAPRDHAVVVGGSMAGLLAARVLANHVATVTVIDRDRFPAGPEFRAGVPQSRHAHALLARGQTIIEGLFPGVTDEVTAAGAVPIDVPGDVLAVSRFGWAGRAGPGLHVISLSRELLEFHVRQRLAALPAIRFLAETEVTGVATTAGFVTGVRARTRGAPLAGEKDDNSIDATWVIDASGRDSRFPGWLSGLGYPTPPETTVTSNAGYASRTYVRPPGFVADWKLLFFFPSPDLPRGGVLFPIERGRWLVTLIGVGGELPPTHEDGFLAFAASLRSPMIHHVIRDAAPDSSIHGYRRTENVRRSYDQIMGPAGLIILGDAACAFNPIYGQGMTVAALEAQMLDRALASASIGATAADLEYPTTEGRRSRGVARLVGRYVARLQRVTTRDPVVAAAFREVTQLVRPPAALFAPRIAARVLAPRRIRRRVRPPTTTPFGA